MIRVLIFLSGMASMTPIIPSFFWLIVAQKQFVFCAVVSSIEISVCHQVTDARFRGLERFLSHF